MVSFCSLDSELFFVCISSVGILAKNGVNLTFSIRNSDFDFLGNKLGHLDIGRLFDQFLICHVRLDRVVLGMEMSGGDNILTMGLIRRVKSQRFWTTFWSGPKWSALILNVTILGSLSWIFYEV